VTASDCEYASSSTICLLSLIIRSVNEVVPGGKAVETAISWALKICENSPDAVQATKHGLILGLLRGGIDEAFSSHTWSEASKRVWTGENINVGRIHNDHVRVEMLTTPTGGAPRIC